MKKSILLILLLAVFSTVLPALTLADLPEEDQQAIKECAISYDDEITESNFEALEFIKYEVIFQTTTYVVVKIGDKYVIIPID